MKEFALWLAGDEARYRAVAYGLTLLLAALASGGAFSPWLDRRLATRTGRVLFFGIALLALFGGRLPSLFAKDPLNQDEAQATAQAITALHDPTPWLGFDGNTCGPLNTYLLMLPALFGLHLSFLSTHVIAVLVEFGAIVALYAAFALAVSGSFARLSAVGPTAFFGLATQDHFIHYSNEHLSILLGTAALATTAWGARRNARASWFVTGLLLGAMPLAKLQSLPVAIGTGAVALLVAAATAPARGWLGRWAALLGGALVVPAIILSWAAAAGSIHDFWISYIVAAMSYILYDAQPFSFLTATPEFGRYFDFALTLPVLGLRVIFVRIAQHRALGSRAYVFLAAFFLLACALDAVLAPNRGSLNYLLFAVFSAGAVATAAVALIAESLRNGVVVRLVPALAAFAFVAFAPTTSLLGDYPFIGSVADYYAAPPGRVPALIARYVHPGERLAIWGYRPRYFVETYTLMGTRDAISQYQFDGNFNPNMGYFRARYIADMEKNKPIGFLDAGPESFDFTGAGQFGHEMFPELNVLVNRDYRLVGLEGTTRLYVRADSGRAAAS
jgi:hypothetical protein